MIDIYSTVLLILLIPVAFCYVLVRRKKSEYTMPLLQVYWAGIGSVLFYVLFINASSAAAARFFDGLYYICVDWILLSMMSFILLYTNTRLHTKIFRYLFRIVAAVDILSLLVNNFTGHMFGIETAQYGGVDYWRAVHHGSFYLHLGGCYGMSLFVVILLINRAIRAPKPYKKMHVSILGVFAAVLVVNALCYYMRLPIDGSLVCYVLLGLSICYFLTYASPKGVVESILINVVEDIDNGIVCFDLTGQCIYVNKKARELLQLKGGDLSSVKDTFYSEWVRSHAPNAVDYEHWDIEYPVDGEDHQFYIEFQRLKDQNRSTVGYFYKLTDKTEEMKVFQEGQYLATHDRLTGLYTKDYFFQKAEEIIQRNPEKERYMVCADIKNFKLLNDLFGEEMGDKILVAQAALLKYTNYEDCIQGRISGEKFAMLISKENFNSEMLVKNTGRLQYMIDGKNYKLNIAMGVYNISDPSESPRDMYEKASMAAESQQNDYQKTVVYYDTKMLQQLLQEKSMTDEFENALKMRQFRMFLQPQMDSNGKLVGAETLARWQHPQRGLVFPVDFLSVVEKTALISHLDEYMWELAAERLKKWKDRGIEDVSISVNISAKDFYYINICDVFVGLINKYGISPERLNLEISELELLSDDGPQIQDLKQLQEYGFRLQIDDFGKGYSSLNALQALRANSLKVDMRLMGEAEDPDRSRRILNAIITMGNALDMEVVAERVETAEQVDMLKKLGCNVFQGYYFSRPIPVEEFEEKYLPE